MHAAKIVRRECYFLNVWQEEVIKHVDGSVSDKEGGKLAVKGKLTELGREKAKGFFHRWRAASPNVTIPMGGTALAALYGDTRIMKWRGSILKSELSAEMPEVRKLVPTVHPAASLRGQYVYRYFIISDLQRAKEESQSAAILLPARDLITGPTFSESLEFMRAIKGKDFATDIEVLNGQVSCFSLATTGDCSISIPLVGQEGRPYFTRSEEVEIWLHYAQLMGDPTTLKINQNLIFDIGFLLDKNHIHTRGPLGDTMIANHIMWPDFPKGLDFLCSVHTREPYYKDDGKLWKKPWVDLHQFWRYNARDAAVAYEIWKVQEPLLDDGGYRDTYDATIGMFPAILHMQIRGMKVNAKRLEQAQMEARTRLTEKTDQLNAVADYPFNPGSPKQCIEYFYTAKGIKPYINRKTGRPTADDTAMARLWRTHRLPEAKLCQEIRSLNKLIGTYLEVHIDKDMRIRCSYNPRGTTTGRLSSSKTILGTGMNMQNLHPDFNYFLEAD
jgi:hypothetical protein